MSIGTRPRGADRIRGLYGIADAGASGGDPLRTGTAMLVGGCRLIQLRCKGWHVDETIRVGRELRHATAGYGALLFANDDPEVAIAIGADGLHLGQTDGSVATARARVGQMLIGRSTNSPEHLAVALTEDADYLAFGPLYSTVNLSRPKEVQGLAGLAAVLRAADRPLVGIGGIDASNLEEVRGTGVTAWAVIGAICGASDPVSATRALLG